MTGATQMRRASGRDKAAGRSLLRLCALLSAALAVLLATATSAQALSQRGHLLGFSVGSTGSEAGQMLNPGAWR